MEVFEKLDFYLLPHMFSRMGIVVNGEIFHVKPNARDAFLTFEEKEYGLQFQGSAGNIQSVDELSRTQYIREFQEAAFEKAIGRYLWQNADEVLFFQCLVDVLPQLDEFDSRINNMPKSDLISIRAKEIASMIPSPPGETNLLTRRQIRQTICSLIEEGSPIARFNYSPNLLVIDHEKIYHLTSRLHRGDIVFRKNRGKPKLFKTGEPLNREEFINTFDLDRTCYYLKKTAHSITDEKLDALIRYCQTKGLHAGMQTHIEYERSGVTLIKYDGSEKIFVYVHPMGFAMHDIRRGFTERWYPFRNPPKVGVAVYRRKEKIEVSQVCVDGDINYLHFASKEGVPHSFCKRGQNRPKNISGTWQEEAVIEIMWGVYSLYNGMNADSLKEFSSGALFGEGYRPPLSQREWMTESQVEAEGLIKTNLHPIINTR